MHKKEEGAARLKSICSLGSTVRKESENGFLIVWFHFAVHARFNRSVTEPVFVVGKGPYVVQFDQKMSRPQALAACEAIGSTLFMVPNPEIARKFYPPNQYTFVTSLWRHMCGDSMCG